MATTKRFIDNPLLENTDNVILPCTNVNDGKDYKTTGKELLQIIKNSNPESLNVKVNNAVEAENSLNLGGVAAGDYALKSELPTESLATYGTNWINSVATCRNLLDVLKVETAQEAFKILKQKSDVGDFSGLGLGDYLELDFIPITQKYLGTLGDNYRPLLDGYMFEDELKPKKQIIRIVAFDHYLNAYNKQHHIVFSFDNILFPTSIAWEEFGLDYGRPDNGYEKTVQWHFLNEIYKPLFENLIGVNTKTITLFQPKKNSNWIYDMYATYQDSFFLPSCLEVSGVAPVLYDAENKQGQYMGKGIVYDSGTAQFPLYAVGGRKFTRKTFPVQDKLEYDWASYFLRDLAALYKFNIEWGPSPLVYSLYGDIRPHKSKLSGYAPVFCI